jgi:hypothetical protein
LALAGALFLAVWSLRVGNVGVGVAGAIVGMAGLALRAGRDPERWLRGAEGEERSAEILDRLRPARWTVLHDRSVPGRSINLDHLVIGPSRPIDTRPAAWEADLVAERLDVAVTPIVAVHGTGLAPRGGRSGGVRVVPATALVGYLRSGRRSLNRAQVADLGARADRLFPTRTRSPIAAGPSSVGDR